VPEGDNGVPHCNGGNKTS